MTIGIDAHAELIESRKTATGRLLAIQLKSGPSYFAEKTQVWHSSYRTDSEQYRLLAEPFVATDK